MQKSPIIRLRAPRVRRFVSFLTLLGYLLVCTGLPVPFALGQTAAADGDSTTAYPCQGHRCGCRTAEQCWKACCCLSDLEKRMWAERHGVSLPDYLLSRSSAVAETPSSVELPAEPARACCKKSSSRGPAKPRDCGACPTEMVASSPELQVPTTSAAAEPPTSPSNVEWVSYLASQRCSGGATDAWLNGPTSLPVGSCLVAVSRFEVAQSLVYTRDDTAEAAFSFPPRRPPRFV